MERMHVDASGVVLRNSSGPTTAGVLPPAVASEFASPAQIRNQLSPDSGVLAVLPCHHPAFQRRMFHSTGFRPSSAGLFANASMTTTVGCESFPLGPVMKYVDWAAGHLQLERYTHRYRLQTSCAKLRHVLDSPSGGQPEDLSVAGSGHAPKSFVEEEARDEDAPMEDPDCGKRRAKSANELKFSIANILGTASDNARNSNSIDSRPATPKRPASPSPEPEVDIVTDTDPSTTADKETSGDDKGPDVLTTDSERFSWLQCTRYKPPKLPRSKKKDGSKKRKLGRNPRVPFTQHQVTVLEQKFRQTHYLSSVDVAELSAALNLTETRVKIWFQNRRARERRDRENIQLLQGGNPMSGSSTKNPKPPGADRVSPEPGSAPARSPRDPGQEVISPAPVGLYSHRLQLTNGVAPSIGLGGLAQLGGGLAQLPPGTWPSSLLPKPGVLTQFPGSNRNSAFTPVTYFSYS